MRAERELAGRPTAPGVVAGPAWLLEAPPGDGRVVAPAGRPLEADRARAALAAAADELDAVAERLAADGQADDAAIVATSALMARDPLLEGAAIAACLDRGRPAADAVRDAASHQADVLAALDDPTLAARADDVRSVGRRAALAAVRAASPAGKEPDIPDGAIVVARDLGPADVAELAAGAGGFALAAGATTAHAAIVARSLGLPMVTSLGDGVLDATPGADVVVDGDAGVAVLDPSAERARRARAHAGARDEARTRAAAVRDEPATTTDGRRITVLMNAAAAAEVPAGLDAGAEGIGLLRTELAFLDAPAWPDAEAHRRAVEKVLAPLGRRPATVRVLDFGGDKTPPFLRGTALRGTRLLLGDKPALAAQLRGVLAGRADAQVRIMLPLVEDPAEVDCVRELLGDVDVPVGAMVETPLAAERAAELAAASDFLSIGTNDLTAETLGVDRFAAGDAVAHDPRVLRHVARVADAARAAGVPVEVCGEAASDPVLCPLLVGLGIDELSVGAARVGPVRAWIRALSYGEAEDLARCALDATSADEVAELAAPLAGRLRALERPLLDQAGDDARERGDRGAGVVAVRSQP